MKNQIPTGISSVFYFNLAPVHLAGSTNHHFKYLLILVTNLMGSLISFIAGLFYFPLYSSLLSAQFIPFYPYSLIHSDGFIQRGDGAALHHNF